MQYPPCERRLLTVLVLEIWSALLHVPVRASTTPRFHTTLLEGPRDAEVENFTPGPAFTQQRHRSSHFDHGLTIVVLPRPTSRNTSAAYDIWPHLNNSALVACSLELSPTSSAPWLQLELFPMDSYAVDTHRPCCTTPIPWPTVACYLSIEQFRQ